MGLSSLVFSNQKMENAYWFLKDSSRIKTFEVTLIFWSLLLISFAYPFFTSGNIPAAAGFLGLLAVIIALFFAKRELKNYTEHLTIIVTFLLLVSSLTYSALQIEEGSKYMQFFRAWTFASAEIVLVNQFRRVRTKAIFVSIAFALRCGIIALFEHEVFVEDVMMHNIVTDIFVIYIYYHCEAAEREIFKGFFEYREELVKFKDLLENYLPQSILILDPHKLGPLFSNKAFTKIFSEKLGGFRPSSHLDLSKTKAISSLVLDALDLLQTQNDSIRYVCKSNPDLTRIGNGTNLRHLLQELSTNGFFDLIAVSVAASLNSQDQKASFEVVIMPITWDRVDAVAIVLNDITFQENIIALKQADKNKDLVMASVSHELRTPLNGIIGLLQIIETEQDYSENISLCKDNAILLLNIVNSILDLQQVCNGDLKLKLAQVDIYELLKETVKLFQFMASQKKLDLNLKIRNNVLKFIITDENRVKQLLIHLVSNAIKFTFKGKVDVILEENDNEKIKISILDTGVGIKEDRKKKLFQIYGELEETEWANRNGAGIGLTICNTLVTAFDPKERICFESKEGVGSKFWFNIPKIAKKSEPSENHKKDLKALEMTSNKRIENFNQFKSLQSSEETLGDCEERIEGDDSLKAKLFMHTLEINRKIISQIYHDFPSEEEDDEITANDDSKDFIEFAFSQASKASDSQHESESYLHKDLVLVVDDNPFNLMVAANFLRNLGYIVETAGGGEEALQKTKELHSKKQGLKLIFMDIQMPVMDGYETTARLRKMMEKAEIEETSIIALTAHDREEDVMKCLNAGMVGHLSKPLIREKLERCIVGIGSKKNFDS